MPFSKISVLVPTRKRLPQLRRMINSFVATTVPPETAELVFRVDADDVETIDYLRVWPWTVIVGSRLDGYRSLPRFYNEMREQATGDILMCSNDDVVFVTRGWAQQVLDEANKYPDGIFDLGVETFNAEHYPWSIVSKRAADALGYLNDARLIWSDLFLRDVMREFGRAIRIPHVRVEHEWMGWNADDTFREARQDAKENWDDAYWEKHRACVAEAAKKLEAHVAVAR